MHKIGIASFAALVLTGSAMAEYKFGGKATMTGVFSAEQLDTMRGATRKDSSLYATNWTNDSNGASYTLGNVGTSVTGTVAGQGGWYTYSSNGNSGQYKIISTTTFGRTGQGAQITGAAAASSYRYMYQDLAAQWAARNAGDNVLWAQWDQYAASTSSTSANLGGVSLYNSDYNILGGMAMAYGSGISGYAQRSVFGLAYYTDTSTGTSGNYFFELSDGTSAAPLAKSGGFTRYATSFNQSTGEVNWFYSIDGGSTYTGFFVNGAATGANLMEIDLEVSNQGALNNATSSVIFGDLTVYATPAPGAAAVVGLAGLMARRRRA
jgi:hypothetical protein